jgi:hypothetical protein
MKAGRLISVLVMAFGIGACGCTATCVTDTKPSANGYGPLTFNRAGADFYFSQNGQYARTELGKDGAIEVHLANAPFQLGYNGEQLNIALAQIPISEMSTDPSGYKASRLSGPMTGARMPNSDVLLVYTGTKWNAGNTEFSDRTSMRATPNPGFHYAYQIDKIDFVADHEKTLDNFKGTVYGYIVVYKQPVRQNRDIMPIRLIFDEGNAYSSNSNQPAPPPAPIRSGQTGG